MIDDGVSEAAQAVGDLRGKMVPFDGSVDPRLQALPGTRIEYHCHNREFRANI